MNGRIPAWRHCSIRPMDTWLDVARWEDFGKHFDMGARQMLARLFGRRVTAAFVDEHRAQYALRHAERPPDVDGHVKGARHDTYPTAGARAVNYYLHASRNEATFVAWRRKRASKPTSPCPISCFG